MDPLQTLILQVSAAVGLMIIVGGSVGIVLAKAVALLVDAARKRRAARHNKPPTGLGEQQTQLIHLPAEHTQLFARYEQEMAPPVRLLPLRRAVPRQRKAPPMIVTICLLIGVLLLMGCWVAAVILLPGSSGRHTGGDQ